MSTYIRPQQKNLKEYSDCPHILRDFLRHIVTIDGLAIRTANSYYINLRLFLRYIKLLRDELDESAYDSLLILDINEEELSKVTEDDVINYLYFRTRMGDSKSARSSKLSAIKSFYKYCCNTHPQIFKINPAVSISRPKLPKQQPVYLSVEEALSVLSASKDSRNGPRDFCITTLFLNCGLRVSELVNLNITSIIEGDRLKVHGKGNKERTVYLNESCIKALESWLEVRTAMKGLLDEKALFVSKISHNRMTARSVQMIIANEMKAAGLSGKGYSPHKLRHTAATLMYGSGADILEIKEILGHEHTTTTEIYTHLNNASLKKVADNIPINKIDDE